MKRIGLLSVFLLALAAPALAVVGDISVYADEFGNSCNITDPGGLLTSNIYIVHKFQPGESASGLRFKLQAPAGANWSLVAFSSVFTSTGNVFVDITVGYGGCQSTTTTVGNVLVTSITPSPTCGYASILPNDFTNQLLGTDCSFGEYPLRGGQGIVNPDGSCQCNIATQPTTWGKMKALYR